MSRTLDRYEKYIAAERRIKIGSIFITRYERSRIIGARALQVSFQASPFTQIPPELTDPIEIAAYELEHNVLPITIKRKMPNGENQMIPVSWLINESY